MNTQLYNLLLHNQSIFNPVVEFYPATDKLLALDFTENNKELTEDIFTYTKHFTWYIDKKLEGYKYGIGGYNEDRVLYKRSKHFDGKEKRTIHLGIDIWGATGTKVYAPIGGMVHSFAFNNIFGDYGATIILQHQIDTVVFHTLYGHLSLKDIASLHEGKYISRGELIGHFGEPSENGDWPPHLHFQIIDDMRINRGDYPGVCSITEREKYLSNCPDADLILNMRRYIL
jgi:peptidoglycan LD-endopeptidase LytH